MQTSNPYHKDQTFCAALLETIGRKLHLHKSSIDSPPYEDKKTQTGKADKKDQNEIETIIKKLRKILNMLPSTLQYSDAFSPGDEDCETCCMTKEAYKKEIHQSRIVDKLVEDVIEKEQSQSLDREQSDQTDKNRFSTDSNAERNEKQTKYTLSFGIYCEGDPTTHSLKCILINLQKTIRDILVQIAFVKTRKLGDEERYRPFNISVRAFKYLKYEYSNLIDIIVSLFDKPVKKTGTPVCVTCVKQKLLANNDVLNRILTDHGRGLKIVMRNESMNQGEGPCCSRDYPHVHADVQGKPVVLKYVLVCTSYMSTCIV